MFWKPAPSFPCGEHKVDVISQILHFFVSMRMRQHSGAARRAISARHALFRHATAGCAAPCLRCGHGHVTTNCTQRRSYADATVRHRDNRPRGPQPTRVPEACENPERLVVDSDPSILPRVPPPPCADRVSSAPSGEDASAASSSEAAPKVPAATDGPKDADVLDSDSERLVIVEGDGDVTPGQGDPPCTPVLPASATSGELSRDSASAEDADMTSDRSDAKRGISTKSSRSNATRTSRVKKKRLGQAYCGSNLLVL
ncbi:hypothetical protein HPB47_006625 [Ixodes persulcatus]|uniref:Uncharacterized protein n=1 Tax=Ixodes persulcatus TaxID=34615 RepID=A0AC60P9V5_IXOPE|nr:hypothetical protein HPB47_006625 [Ixodes persulcatus]